MKRGQIISTVGRGDFSRKPRPSLVIQAELFSAYHPAITVCPITSFETGDTLYRVPIPRTDDNGLLADSEIEIDLIQAIRRERIGSVIGMASDEIMFTVDQALRRWLAL
ncbi:type II toxin-antitoxin system PemK/MazF family toxin [Sphingomonas sp. PB2P19]|uniref:type II toxin-antitoxin system PemK/MazF family toxin n=1 Tax=Sphingomonas rhamnosi TaxID=3096156 RepID=UPI002FCB24C0